MGQTYKTYIDGTKPTLKNTYLERTCKMCQATFKLQITDPDELQRIWYMSYTCPACIEVYWGEE